jgi:hypothetical protein
MPSDTYTLVVSDVGFATPIDGSVTTVKIADANVTLAKLQNIATDNLIGRSTAGTGVPELIPCTSFARTLLDDSNAATAQATLGLGNLATQNSNAITVTGGSISGVTLSGSILSSATVTGGTVSSATITGCTITGGSISVAALTGTVAVANGGTNLSSYTAGDLIYASGATALSKLAAGAASTVLLSGTTPSWGKVPLDSHVTGVLPTENGGTGHAGPAYGSLYSIAPLTGQAITAGTYVKLNADTIGDSDVNFTTDGTTNRLKYTETEGRAFIVSAIADITGTTADVVVYMRIALNGTTMEETECRGLTGGNPTNTENDHLVSLSTTWIIQLALNSYVEIFVTTDVNHTITARRVRLTAAAIP